MAAMSNYLENKIIDHVLRGTPYTAPTTVYFALLTAAPSDAGGGTEVTGGSYARVALTANTTNFAGTQAAASTAVSSGTNGTTSNNVVVTFPTPTANWGVATHMAVYDATTSGNLLVYGALNASKTINNGDAAPSFAAAAFTWQVDN